MAKSIKETLLGAINMDKKDTNYTIDRITALSRTDRRRALAILKSQGKLGDRNTRNYNISRDRYAVAQFMSPDVMDPKGLKASDSNDAYKIDIDPIDNKLLLVTLYIEDRIKRGEFPFIIEYTEALSDPTADTNNADSDAQFSF